MSRKPNPAAPILLHAAKLLRDRMRELEINHSVNGIGKVWKSEAAREMRDDCRHHAHELESLSAAFGRSALVDGPDGNPRLINSRHPEAS